VGRSELILDVLLHRKEPKIGLGLGLVIAVILHVIAVPGFDFALGDFVGNRPKLAQNQSKLVGVKAAPAGRRLEFAIQDTIPLPAPEEIEEELPRGQVVKLPAKKEEQPLAADYLAEQSQRTERETRARVTGMTETATRRPQDGRKKPVDTSTDAATDAPPDPLLTPAQRESGGPTGDGIGERGDAPVFLEHAGGAPQELAMELPRLTKMTESPKNTVKDGVPVKPQDARDAMEGNSPHMRLALGRIAERLGEGGLDGRSGQGLGRKGGSGDELNPPGRLQVTPSLTQLERISGLPANDHLLEETDDETALNTWRFKHATFFNRVADAIRREWKGGAVLNRYDPGGRVFGHSDRATMVRVTLDRSGNVVDLAVAEQSGAGPLDDEAIRAFRRAGPFPNPPAALFAGAEKFTFLFGFHVTYNRSNIDLNWRPY
jgi:TonB family protein